MPALDGVRGLAVLMVLLFHFIGGLTPTNGVESVVFGVMKYGSYGVELFFVLSGFLITGILYDTRETTQYFRNFFMRRVLRIFPLYYAVLIAVFLIAPLIPLFRGPTLDALVEKQAWAWLYAVNLYIAKEGAWSFSYLQHFWSLAIEEHFYLFWPFVVFALMRRPARLAQVCLVLAITAMVVRVAAIALGMNGISAYVLTPLRLDGLALGAWLAIVVRRPGGQASVARWLPHVVTALGLALIVSFPLARTVGLSGSELLAAIRGCLAQMLLACLVITAVMSPTKTFVSRLFTSHPLVWLGTYSYGLYVYHHFLSYAAQDYRTVEVLATWTGSHMLAVVMQASVGIGLSCLIAYLSYEHFEKRFLAFKKHFEPGRANALERVALEKVPVR
jgi:peptidoglycan/LPS O-acetylase OafA/YrhL